MDICEINPYLRFATEMRYTRSLNKNPVKVSDCRIFYITEGQAVLHIAGESFSLQPHSLFYCCAGSCYTIDASEGFSLICLNFDLSQNHRELSLPLPVSNVKKAWPQLPVYFEAVEDSVFLGSHLFVPHADSLQGRLQRIVSRRAGGTALDRAQSQTELKLLLLELHRLSKEQLPPRIAAVMTYIRQHYAEDITNRQLAELAGYHEYYLNRVFCAHTGRSLHSFLLQVRLNHAAFLILNTDLELKEIPERVGFGSYPHFSGYFKKAYGHSPAEYRKRLRSGI